MARLAALGCAVAAAACSSSAPSSPPPIVHDAGAGASSVSSMATDDVLDEPNEHDEPDDLTGSRRVERGPRQRRNLEITLRSSPGGATAAVDGIIVGRTPVLWQGEFTGRDREFTFVLSGYALARYRFVPITDGVVHGRLERMGDGANGVPAIPQPEPRHPPPPPPRPAPPSSPDAMGPGGNDETPETPPADAALPIVEPVATPPGIETPPPEIPAPGPATPPTERPPE